MTTKPERSATADDLLAEDVAGESLGALRDGGTGLERRHQFDERQHRNRVEEVHTDDSLGTLGRDAELHDRDRRRVGRENRIRIRHDRVEFGEDFALDLLVFDDGLHDELAVREISRDRR